MEIMLWTVSPVVSGITGYWMDWRAVLVNQLATKVYPQHNVCKRSNALFLFVSIYAYYRKVSMKGL